VSDTSPEFLAQLCDRLTRLAHAHRSFRFIEFSGLAAADDVVVGCALELFTDGLDSVSCPDADDSVFCLYAEDLHDSISDLRAVVDDVVAGVRCMQDCPGRPEDEPPMDPFPTLRGEEAPFIMAKVMLSMSEQFPQNLREEFAPTGLKIEVTSGNCRIYRGPVRLEDAGLLVFPGEVLVPADPSAEGWQELKRAVTRGELHASLSLAPLFELIGGMFTAHLDLERFIGEVERRRAEQDATRSTEADTSPTEGVQRCWFEAYQSFRRAIVAPAAPPVKPLKGVWDWLKEHDPDREYELPRFETWAKYVRSYERSINGKQNESRGGRAGRSTAAPDDL
jgi:hypothetical protein